MNEVLSKSKVLSAMFEKRDVFQGRWGPRPDLIVLIMISRGVEENEQSDER